MTGLCGYSAPDMCGLRLIMIPVELLLCYVLLHPVDATSSGKQTNVLMHLPLSLESQTPSSDPLSCQFLHPKSLPGFSHMAPLPKFLGGVNATQVLIQHLRGLQTGRSTERNVSVEALASALQLLAREQQSTGRVRRSLPTEDCENEKEQGMHNVIQLLPGVGTFYNLGTALYYATQNCLGKARERGRDGAIDLGYDLLMTMAGMSGGPMGLAISAALKPALRSGVQQLIQYYQDRKDANISQPETTKEGLRAISDVSDLEETTTLASFISEVVSSAPYWGWAIIKSYDLDPGAGSLGI
ncbi:apolipoprotein F isoform X2 [Macaca mulatta]|uniref:apolipoprotein F isoform X3 n=1 Tax=Macaca mulatta TaxID=9544 RepID=UPI0007328B5C|nr:apolipoprotein F isoform X3 [Macaca mulatta]XP_045221388.1 apolipoprotein F isoform X2 [Macaca fascicularis]